VITIKKKLCEMKNELSKVKIDVKLEKEIQVEVKDLNQNCKSGRFLKN
jgi:hypothetical protein